ncbi:MAG: hypothetical protein CMF94_05200 [Candidatus Marinimicrobia bacterium]|nr:hypothetical protein [Candidatus Neomarinimicrobiota bacterium]
MITIFCTPKNFEGIFDIIQKNAIRSWRHLSNDIEIIIFGDSKGAKEISDEVEGIYYPDVKCSKNGVPLLSDLFLKANAVASYNILLFINSDILLPKKVISVVKKANNVLAKFLLIGYRFDLRIEELINFDEPKALSKFWEKAKSKSKKKSPAAIDYFIFRKNSLKKIPDFVVGRPGYDNWLVWYARRKFMSVVDISNDVLAVHQNHHFNFHNLKNNPKIFDRDKIPIEEDGLINLDLHGDRVLNLLDANYFIEDGMILKKRTKYYKYRNLGKLPIIFYEFSLILNLYKKLCRIFLYNTSEFE